MARALPGRAAKRDRGGKGDPGTRASLGGEANSEGEEAEGRGRGDGGGGQKRASKAGGEREEIAACQVEGDVCFGGKRAEKAAQNSTSATEGFWEHFLMLGRGGRAFRG